MPTKDNIGEDLLRYQFHKYKYIIWDLETENLNLFFNRPWEVGYAVAHGKKIVKRVNKRILWPDLDISPAAAQVCQFDLEEYKATAEDALEVLNEFEGYLYNDEYVSVFYNGINFDSDILQNWRRGVGKESDYSFMGRSLDVLALGRAYNGSFPLPKTKEEFYEWQHKMLNYLSDPKTRRQRSKEIGSTTLQKLCAALDVQVDSDGFWHKGLYDVVATFRVLEQLLFKIEITTEHLKPLES